MSTIFERLDALEADMATLKNDFTSMSETLDQILNAESDSGWMDLELLGDVQAYNVNGAPKYRKIGNVVFLRGAVKNVLTRGTNIALLPEDCWPAVSVSVTQNTTMRTGDFAMIARLSVKSTGQIQVEAISDGAAFGETKWFPIDCCFSVE